MIMKTKICNILYHMKVTYCKHAFPSSAIKPVWRMCSHFISKTKSVPVQDERESFHRPHYPAERLSGLLRVSYRPSLWELDHRVAKPFHFESAVNNMQIVWKGRVVAKSIMQMHANYYDTTIVVMIPQCTSSF